MAAELVVCGTSLVVAYVGRKREWGRLPRLLAWAAALPAFLALPGWVALGNVRGTIAFMLCWTCPSKLLLLCFDISLDSPPSWSTSHFSHFLSSSLLPIRVIPPSSPLRLRVPLLFALATSLLFNLVALYPLPLLYFATLYTALQLSHSIYALLMYAFFHVDLLPAFNHPFAATSLADFWGHRWNLSATSMLRATVYEPVLWILLRGKAAAAAKGRVPTWARAVALWATFAASGLIHEFLLYHITQSDAPTWEAMAFFVLQGVATSAEVALKRAWKGRWVMPRGLRVVLTQSFLYSTGVWLFLPALCRSDTDSKMVAEILTLQTWVVSTTKSWFIS